MDEEYENLLIGVGMFIDLMKVYGKTYDQAVATLYNQLKDEFATKVLDHWNEMVRLAAEPTDGLSLVKGIGAAEPWYAGPRANDVYWPSLRSHLIEHSTSPWTRDDVDALDRASTVVLASCRSPWDSTSSGRGLVVGHVQSGKTTNFTAVIAKAADAGFRLFIVLSGTTKSLRHQTQVRLERQLKDLNSHAWYFHTTTQRDVGKRTNWVPFLGQKEMRTCIVVKKNSARLRNLNASLDEALQQGLLNACPILVIDDEGDNASISPNCDRNKATVINREIVALLARPRVSYVSYTATPFANCFVDPDFEENLFPRDFIVALPEPPDYFGSRRMFGDGERPEVAAVLDVPVVEAEGYLPPPPTDTTSLDRSIRWFLMAATVRRLRADGVQPHSTMLVNVSERTGVHADYWRVVRDAVVGLAARIRSNDAGLMGELERQWDEDRAMVDPADFGLAPVPFGRIRPELATTIDLLGDLGGADHNSNEDCGIVVDNSASAVRLAYDERAPRPVIVVGGNTMSRGLTLEGLVTTFFLRSTRLYDTLLQMGRWFGYRRGYEDLFRVYMPDEMRGRFAFLARIERELRDWIAMFAQTGRTPLDFGPKFRMHPHMQVTRSALMKRVKVENLDLSGTQPETSYFENTPAAVTRSRDALVRLVNSMSGCPSEKSTVGRLFRDVPAADIATFLHPIDGLQVIGHSYLTNENFQRYLELKMGRGELLRWSVLLRTTRGGGQVDFLPGVDVTTVTRTRKSASGDFVDVGSLADSGDKWADVPGDRDSTKEEYRSTTPLLVVYVIDKDSRPDAKGLRNKRQPLNAVGHLVGIALFLPLSQHDDDLGKFVAPVGPWDSKVIDEPIDEPDPDDDDEDDAEGDPVAPR